MLLGLLFVLFAGMSVVAVLWRGKDTLLGYEKLLGTTGIGGTDYLLELGGAVTLLNMGLNGLFATFFVLAVGGNLNGPTIGGIFTIVGFSATGKHLRNIFPIMAGVCIASTVRAWDITNPSALLALLFSTTLAPDRRRVWNFMRRVSRFSARVGGAQCRDRVWGHEPL